MGFFKLGSEALVFERELKRFLEKRVDRFMTKDVFTVPPGESLINAANIMIGHHIASLVVAEKESPVGIITERDFLRQPPEKMEDLVKGAVGDIMTKDPVTAQPNLTMQYASDIMNKHKFRKLIVTDKGTLAGIVTQTDLMREMDAFYRKNAFKTSDSLTVKAVMKDAITVSGKATIGEVHEVMVKDDVGSVFVTEKGKLVGAFTEFDFLSRLALDPEKMLDMEMQNVMSYPLVGLDAGVDLMDANHMMREKGFRRFPVFDNGELVGKVTQTTIQKNGFDLLKTTLKRAEEKVLDEVNFELVKPKKMIREIHGKTQVFRYS